jgi:hypothetical protein
MKNAAADRAADKSREERRNRQRNDAKEDKRAREPYIPDSTSSHAALFPKVFRSYRFDDARFETGTENVSQPLVDSHVWNFLPGASASLVGKFQPNFKALTASQRFSRVAAATLSLR